MLPSSSTRFISQKVLLKLFCKSRFPHKSVSLSFIITNIKKKLTNSRRNSLLQNDFTNFFCEIQVHLLTRVPLPSEEGTPSRILRAFTTKPRPEAGLGCLSCAEFAPQRRPKFRADRPVVLPAVGRRAPLREKKGPTRNPDLGALRPTVDNTEGKTMGNTVGNIVGNTIGNTVGNTVCNAVGNTVGNTGGSTSSILARSPLQLSCDS